MVVCRLPVLKFSGCLQTCQKIELSPRPKSEATHRRLTQQSLRRANLTRETETPRNKRVMTWLASQSRPGTAPGLNTSQQTEGYPTQRRRVNSANTAQRNMSIVLPSVDIQSENEGLCIEGAAIGGNKLTMVDNRLC